MTVDDAPAVKVGIRLDADPGTLGAWLADGSAFDAAGADSLWIDVGDRSRLDPVVLAAALAAATARAEVVLALDETTARAAGLDRRLDTLRQLSHGRLVVAVDGGSADGVVTEIRDLPVLRREPDGSGWIDERAGAGDLARWLSAPAPEGRAAWRETRAGAAARGAHGLVLAAGPQLLDILRNPDDPGGRGDLRLAQG